VAGYLARSIFFNDDARVSDITGGTRQFVLAGPQADAIIRVLSNDLANAPGSPSRELQIAGHPARFTRVRPVSGAGWSVVLAEDAAEAVWRALLAAGRGAGLRPAGSLTYHVLRVRAGRPGVGRELSSDYIPLEIGLWDEVSFSKGCYTGQEIIARMESRRRLAKTIVTITLDGPAEAPCPLHDDGKLAGMLTSSAQAPGGERYGIGIVRMSSAQPGRVLSAGEAHARIERLAGVQPVLQAETD
jgi:aminomethyltransferase